MGYHKTLDTKNRFCSDTRRRSTLTWGWIAVVTVAFVVYALHTPAVVNGLQSYDDALFIGRALNVVAGQWLGPYGEMTLAKGPGYPLFLAAGYVLGLPITFWQVCLLIAGCLCVSFALWRATGSRGLFALIYTLLLWHPALLMSRVIRDAIVPSQVLLIFGGLLFLARSVRRGNIRPWVAAGVGVAFAFFWFTREDGVWMLPGVAVLVLGVAFLQWRRRMQWRPLMVTVAIALVAFGACDLLLRTVNRIEYGQFTTVEITAGAFEHAVDALQSVRVDATVPYVPVPLRVREAIYKVSPAFARLEPYFDGKGAALAGWKTFGCELYKHTCGDYAGGWFIWALRSGVSDLGYYRNPHAATTYYKRVAAQVELACRDGKLKCGRTWLPLMPSIARSQLMAMPAEVWRSIETVTLLRNVPPLRIPPSIFRPGTGSAVEDLLGRPLLVQPAGTSHSTLSLSGWFYLAGRQWFTLGCTDGAPTHIAITRSGSPDVAQHFSDVRATEQRFIMNIPVPTCQLDITTPQGSYPFGLSAIRAGAKNVEVGNAKLRVDTQKLVGISLQSPLNEGVQALRSVLLGVYQILLPLLLVAGLACFLVVVLICLYSHKVTLTWDALFALTAWVLIATKIASISLVTISAFPAVNRQYLMPAYPLLCLGSVLSIWCLYRYLRVLWRLRKS